ncbi:hypothetical protein RHEph03_gp059 [Rhizobium phage RHEph03]|uniref:Uncharacterized protein n=2 Tax=Cuernavacavirus RHEph02 TaxID=2733899 RepID=L7TR93_9CAUD|nr:hypothetical protein HOS21_gp59 [Rhizobium phage RHEph02]AGC35626.1 hypothetical protein RHEph02_gp059 [Rhizobium phage RHEph02]AGC35686.1 hypothetical protein RHEph03_gp059 [Rhizobium phage RHEph03]
MAATAMIIATPEQKAAAEAINAEAVGAQVMGLLINNPAADRLGYGTLVGNYVFSVNTLNDPLAYQFWPVLGELPIRIIDIDVIFLPVEV